MPVRTLYTHDADEAAAILRRGGLVAFPTETVYGLGADAHSADGVARIFAAKGRPPDNPLIVHLADADPATVSALAAPHSADARHLADAFWPGPLTLVAASAGRLPAVVTAGLGTVALRVPARPLTRAFLRACGVPVAAPSANLSGRPSPTTWEAVREDLDGRIDAVLMGAPCEAGLESTVVDVSVPGEPPMLLRPGALGIDALRAVVPALGRPGDRDEALARSPGTRHRHYAPRARVVVVAPGSPLPPGLDRPVGWIGVGAPPPGATRVFAAADVDAYARLLFAAFRMCEAEGIATIVCERVDDDGIGQALNDRITRAAQG